MSNPPNPIPYRSIQPAIAPQPNCPKCGQRMLQGIAVAQSPLRWIEGELTRVFGLTRMPRGKRYEIITFRCPACGLLQSYSPPG